MAVIQFNSRREDRQSVEMLSRFRHGLSTITVVLKDLTQNGARLEGIGHLRRDEAVFLTLPGMKPQLSFIAWSNGHASGLEFSEPLPLEVYKRLVAVFGRGKEISVEAA